MLKQGASSIIRKRAYAVKQFSYYSPILQRSNFNLRKVFEQKNQSSMISRLLPNKRLETLRKKIDDSPSEQNLQEYFKELVNRKPSEAMTQIEEAWQNEKLPVNEFYLKEYLKAASALNQMDYVNVPVLLKLINKSNSQKGSDGVNASKDLLSRLVGSEGAGSTPERPVFVKQTKEINYLSIFFRVLVGGVIAYYVLTQGLPKGVGPNNIGSASIRLGMPTAIHEAERSDKTFDDVVGVDEAKAELEEIVLYLKDPSRFTRLGGRLPKGVLLTGPPGTGKTLLARAVAGEANVPFFHASGSEFEEMFVGVGAKRIRELFEVAKKRSPCIIFIDEIDAIGGSRHLKDQSAMKMTLNQLLVEMDGFEQNNGVLVIAATNFADSLDSALVRPGRFDKHVVVPYPDVGGRQAILNLYTKKIPFDPDVDIGQLARGTPGFSGAELFNLVNQAALKASMDGLSSVGMAALEYAKDKIMMGSERKSAIISPETMKTTAFHEAGHALVALKTCGADPIHKATIMPRGRSLGMVMQLPDGDQTSMTRKQMLARLDICMGGRIAEEIVFGSENVTSGATSDIQQATRLATAMVTKYGFSEKVGVMFLDDKKKTGGKVQQDADEEVKSLLSASYERAKRLIESHRDELEIIAKGLMEYESLSGSEIVDLLKGNAPNHANWNGKKRSHKPSREVKPIIKVPSPISPNVSTSKSSPNHSTPVMKQDTVTGKGHPEEVLVTTSTTSVDENGKRKLIIQKKLVRKTASDPAPSEKKEGGSSISKDIQELLFPKSPTNSSKEKSDSTKSTEEEKK